MPGRFFVFFWVLFCGWGRKEGRKEGGGKEGKSEERNPADQVYIKAESKIHSYTSFEWERKRESALPPHSLTSYPIHHWTTIFSKDLSYKNRNRNRNELAFFFFFFFFGLRYCG